MKVALNTKMYHNRNPYPLQIKISATLDN